MGEGDSNLMIPNDSKGERREEDGGICLFHLVFDARCTQRLLQWRKHVQNVNPFFPLSFPGERMGYESARKKGVLVQEGCQAVATRPRFNCMEEGLLLRKLM
ncbi:hypothetical protein CEXT_455391 [Caerostris extrusa]|uniref:Uncharacterized protein n=1 Tax=Caerostris extrusa TaxID=172846 RepID=A0AAV4VQS2_CAEEX|nr:hypothetical protein CEXT_455391 [Caerostris extrusa]